MTRKATETKNKKVWLWPPLKLKLGLYRRKIRHDKIEGVTQQKNWWSLEMAVEVDLLYGFQIKFVDHEIESEIETSEKKKVGWTKKKKICDWTSAAGQEKKLKCENR